MASSVSAAMAATFSYSPSSHSLGKVAQKPRLHLRRSAVASPRAETVNPAIRKEEAKVVDTVLVPELSKPLTAYCRYKNNPYFRFR